MSEYRYELIDTGANSSVLGRCEVCGGPATTIYHQIEGREYVRPDGSRGLTHAGCQDRFGHGECLTKMRHDHRWENLAEGLTGGRV